MNQPDFHQKKTVEKKRVFSHEVDLVRAITSWRGHGEKASNDAVCVLLKKC